METINKETNLKPGQLADTRTYELMTEHDDGRSDTVHECDHEVYGHDWGAEAYRKLVQKESRPKENLSEGYGLGKYEEKY